jgi:hypothetical protein
MKSSNIAHRCALEDKLGRKIERIAIEKIKARLNERLGRERRIREFARVVTLGMR